MTYDAWDLPPLVNNFVPNGGSLADYFFCIEQKRGVLLTVAEKRATMQEWEETRVSLRESREQTEQYKEELKNEKAREAGWRMLATFE